MGDAETRLEAVRGLPEPIAVWTGCYDESWKGVIVPAAFRHPAKMARGLLCQIFDTLLEMGAVGPGSVVVDPFGGIGSTGIEAAVRGCQGICCELEPTFVELARQNFAAHARDWADTGRPQPIIVQGDSRTLRAHVGPVLAACVVSSPPYVAITTGAGGLNTTPAGDGQQGGRSASSPSQDTDARYGESAGQLARLPAGAVDAVVCSPPFASGDTASAQSISERSDKSASWVKANCGSAATQGYGVSDGQLGVMPLDQANAHGETFWSAAQQIVAESYAILKPGGLAVWVVKAFVRHKTIVDFPEDWRRLCASVGFETILEAHAMLVEETRTTDLFGDERVRRRERKSFFRRLAEKKGSPRIDYEVVLFTRKPGA